MGDFSGESLYKLSLRFKNKWGLEVPWMAYAGHWTDLYQHIRSPLYVIEESDYIEFVLSLPSWIHNDLIYALMYAPKNWVTV